jgi:hypothetical protein
VALERKERVAHGGLFTWDFIRASTYDSGRPARRGRARPPRRPAGMAIGIAMGHAPWRRDPHAAPAPTPTPRARARHLIPRAARHISRARKASSWLACSLLCPLVWRHRPLTTCGCTSSQFGALCGLRCLGICTIFTTALSRRSALGGFALRRQVVFPFRWQSLQVKSCTACLSYLSVDAA